jgi:hypothetical protein
MLLSQGGFCIDGMLAYVDRFVTIVQKGANLKLSKDWVVKAFFANIKDEGFKEHVQHFDIKAEEYSSWANWIGNLAIASSQIQAEMAMLPKSRPGEKFFPS